MARSRYNRYNMKASFSYEEAIDGYKCQFPYDESVITWLKFAIPASDRSWNPDEKAWYIGAKYFDGMYKLLEGKGYQITVFSKEDFVKFKEEQAKLFEEQQRAAKQMRNMISVTDEWNKFKVLVTEAGFSIPTATTIENCDSELAKTLYRKTSLKFHPDRNNGDGRKMAELNVVWKNLKEYHYDKQTTVC